MKKHIPLLLVLLSFSSVGQDFSNGTFVWLGGRLKLSEPPYGLKKISQAVAFKYGISIKRDKKFYNSLSLREKFTYNMLYGESFMQNCSMVMQDTEIEKKIFARLPSPFGENHWSMEQRSFFTNNRDSVIYLMKECIGRTKEIGVNFKNVFTDINAKELIPVFSSTYLLTKKDHDILTALALLMKVNGYPPFLKTGVYYQLYGNQSDYSAFIPFTAADGKLILSLSTDFYNAGKK